MLKHLAIRDIDRQDIARIYDRLGNIPLLPISYMQLCENYSVGRCHAAIWTDRHWNASRGLRQSALAIDTSQMRN